MSVVLAGVTPFVDPEAAYFAGTGRREPAPEETPAPDDDRLARLEAAEKIAAASSTKVAPDSTVLPCPLAKRHTIEVRVADAADRPVEDVALVLVKSDTEALLAKTDAGGLARFRGLEPGPYAIYPRDLDRDAWELAAIEALPPERDDCQGDAAWGAPTAPRGPVTHVVAEGECVSTLAARYGLLPDTIWNAGENGALQELRKDKNILNPKDRVVIPAPRRTPRSVEAGNAYRVRIKSLAETLRIRFLDAEGKARAGLAYLIALTGPEGTEERAGKTNGEGFLIEPTPATVQRVKITAGKKPSQEVYELRAAVLDPIDTVSGAQTRLTHLGYTCGDEDGEIGRWTKRALRDFQKDHDLPVTSALDDATRDKLREEYLA